MLAEILKEVEQKDGAFCARFGGDEFILIASGRSLREVEGIAQRIKDRVLERRVPHGYSRASEVVTISQGYCYGVPTQHKKLNDYIYVADGAMYDVKESTKNDFKIVEMSDDFRPLLSSACPV